MNLILRYNALLLCVSSLFAASIAMSSMSVDLGSDSMKVAVVLPKVPMEVALDAQAKRKTPTAVGFRDGERVFGIDAVSMAATRPSYVYQSISSIIGKHIDHPAVKLYRQRFPFHNMTYDESTGQLIFHHPEGMSFTVEELVAMLLEYARNVAEYHSGSVMKTCVVTVPSFYGQAERESLARAVRIAGLELQQLINVNTAVALDFGIFRRNKFTESAQYFMFFDVGYISTTATVVSYQIGKHHQGGKSAQDPILTIMGVGFAPSLGTSSLIYRIRDHFAQVFSESAGIPINILHQNARAMSRLLKEAVRVFTILSANTEATAQLDQLADDKDFRAQITREKMETLCEEEFNAFRKPFTEALTSSGIDLAMIQEIVLMGGGTRIPKVQEILMTLGQRSELGKGLNNDEAAVMGAVYQAAFHTPGFRVLPFVVRDYNAYTIAVDFKRAPQATPTDEKSDSGEANADIRRVLFPRGNPFPQKRAITFNRHTTDLTFYVNYVELRDEESAYLRQSNLTRATTEGVAKAVKKNPGSELRGVKAHFSLDYSGRLTLTGIDCLFFPLAVTDETRKDESVFQKLNNTISRLFGVGANTKSNEELEANNTTENTTVDMENETNSSQPVNQTAANGTETNNRTTENITQNISETSNLTEKTQHTHTNATKELKPFTERIGFHQELLYGPVPSDAEIEKSIKKLRDLRQADEARREREKMANELESSIFTMREEIETTVYITHSTAEERQQLSDMLTNTLNWFEEQDAKTSKEVYEEKLLELRRIYLPINVRVTEAQKRPGAFEELNRTITQALGVLVKMREINDVLYHLDQSMKEKKKLEQKQRQEKVAPADEPLPQTETTKVPDVSEHPPTLTPPSNEDANVSADEDSPPVLIPKPKPSESKDEKPMQTESNEEQPEPPFVPLFADTEMESLKKLAEELRTWITDSVKLLNEAVPHQTPPVRIDDIHSKRILLKSKLVPLETKLTLFQSEMERAHHQQQQQQQRQQKKKASKSKKEKSIPANKTKPEALPDAPAESTAGTTEAPKVSPHLEL